MQPVLRPARMCDAKKIHGLLMECSAEGLLLPRSLSNLYGQIRDFRILETSGGEFIGCAALAVIWENLAEVRSLAIAKPWLGNGFGNILVDECCKDIPRRYGSFLLTTIFRCFFLSTKWICRIRIVVGSCRNYRKSFRMPVLILWQNLRA